MYIAWKTTIGVLLFAYGAAAQTVSGIGTEGLTPTWENAAVRDGIVGPRGAANHLDPRIVVFTGDSVIPHFIDGQFWQTAITVVNLENHPTSFQVLFFQDDGTDFYVPVLGIGVVRGMNITLSAAGSYTFETAGISQAAGSGWALLSQANKDSVGSFAIFRYSPPGVPQQEAVVPTVNQFFDRFVLPFDNTGRFATGVAISNPSPLSVSIEATVRNEAGQTIDRRTVLLGKYAHQAFVLPTAWSSTAGIRGTVEFLSTGFGVGALGIRGNGNSFTSLNVISNLNWLKF